MSDLRQIIIDASVAIIAKEGVRALSFREVARKAQVSHQAPYHYFDNHLAILKTIAQDGFLKLAKTMETAAKKHQDPLRALNASGIAYVQFASENLGYFRVMFQRPLISEKKMAQKMPESEAAHGVLLALAKKVWDAGVGNHVPVETLALLCWSTVHGIASLLTEEIVGENKLDENVEIGSLVVLALGGLLKSASSMDVNSRQKEQPLSDS